MLNRTVLGLTRGPIIKRNLWQRDGSSDQVLRDSHISEDIHSMFDIIEADEAF